MNNYQHLKFRIQNIFSPSFHCPICRYRGPFQTARPGHALRRRHALCPKCGCSERQRAQWLIMQELSLVHDFRGKFLLHFAPEPIFRSEFKKLFAQVTTTDLEMSDVDVKADICQLPFEDASFDVLFLSHVLEHVKEDKQAMSEVRRILRPGGLSVVEVPVTCEKTIEYDRPNPCEFGHIRNTGADYYDKFADLFGCLKKITSDDLPSKNQPYIYCDWTGFPTSESPLRKSMPGKRHPIIVAVYYV